MASLSSTGRAWNKVNVLKGAGPNSKTVSCWGASIGGKDLHTDGYLKELSTRRAICIIVSLG